MGESQAKIELDKILRDELGEDYRENLKLNYQIVTKNENGELDVEDIYSHRFDLDGLLESITKKETILIASSEETGKQVVVGAAEKDGRYIISNDIVYQDPEQDELEIDEKSMQSAIGNHVTADMVDESFFEKFIEFIKGLFEVFMSADDELAGFVGEPLVSSEFDNASWRARSFEAIKETFGLPSNLTGSNFWTEPEKWIFKNDNTYEMGPIIRTDVAKFCATAQELGLEIKEDLKSKKKYDEMIKIIHQKAATKMREGFENGEVLVEMHMLMESAEQLAGRFGWVKKIEFEKDPRNQGVENMRGLCKILVDADQARRNALDLNSDKEPTVEDVAAIEKGKAVKEYFQAFKLAHTDKRENYTGDMAKDLEKMLNNYKPGPEYDDIVKSKRAVMIEKIGKRLAQDMMRKKIRSDMQQEIKQQKKNNEVVRESVAEKVQEKKKMM